MPLLKRSLVYIIIGLAILGGTGCMNNIEEQLLADLEAKYDEEFVIEHYDEGGVFYSSGPKGISATVHVKDEPDVVFTMKESSKEKGKFNDGYLLARWGKELEEKYASEIEKHLPEGADYRLFLRSGVNTFDESMKDYTAEQFIQSNKDMLVELKVSIKVSNEPDVSQYSEGIFNLYNFIQSFETESYRLTVGFVDEEEDISEYLRTAFVNNVGYDNLNAKIYGVVSMDYRIKDLVNSANDVNEWYSSFEE